jgi:RNA polymerase sigma-70 factor (ECF subfamily)
VQSDTELLDAWAAGDERSGRALYQRYAGRVTRFFAQKLRDDPADLVQRTFLKCLDAKKRGAEVGDAAAMLFAIARNELYDHLRARMREKARFAPEMTSLEDAGAGPSQIVAKGERDQLLLAALRRIPIDDQIALELYYWEELPMEGVAQALGVTKSAALNRVHRAREALRERLRAMEARAERVDETMSGLETWAKRLADGGER